MTPADKETPRYPEIDERWIDDYIDYGFNAIERCLWVNSPLFRMVVDGWREK